MNITINIDIGYTQRTLETIGAVQDVKLTYAAGIPFPEVGDHIETRSTSGTHALKVIERVFSLETNAMQIRLLLDLP